MPPAGKSGKERPAPAAKVTEDPNLDDVTRHYDGRTASSRTGSDDAEEPTRFFERGHESKAATVRQVPERNVPSNAGSALQRVGHAPMPGVGKGDIGRVARSGGPTKDIAVEVEEPTTFFERPNRTAAGATVASGPGLAGSIAIVEPTFAHSPIPTGRESAISLAPAMVLLSAETTEPPPVVALTQRDNSMKGASEAFRAASSGQNVAALRPITIAPRPDAARATTAAISVETGVSSLARPASILNVLSTTGRGASAVDTESIGERSTDGLGSDIDVGSQGLTGMGAFSIAPRPGSTGFEEEAWLDPLAVRVWTRLVRVSMSCVIAALLVSPLDAWYAQRAAADHPPYMQLVAACAGLLVPIALVLAIAVTGLSVLLHPDAAPSLGQLPQRLRPSDARRKSRLAVIWATAPLAVACWVLLVARGALPLLGSRAPAEVIGTLLAAMAIGLGLLVATPVLAMARYIGVRLRHNPPDPVRCALFGLCVGVLPIILAIAVGPTSGAGSPIAMFGVFKRPELDLRAPGMLLVIAFVGYALPSRLVLVPQIVLLLLTALPLGLTYRAALHGLESRAVALAIERGAPLARMGLGVARRITDRDRDGFSPYFGGGDCDDHQRSRNPGADDLPGNGVDEDCSGSDAAAPEVRQAAITSAELLQQRRVSIPNDLNLIFIIVDTLRADTLHHPKRVTPRLDELAQRSIDVENAYAPASYTGKSVGPILIGKHSRETNRDFAHFAAFSKKDTFVQQRLGAAGIRTLSVQGYWYFYQPPYGFARGFDVVDSDASPGNGYVEGDRTSTSEKLTERILHQLEQLDNTSGRFFLWSQFTDPHAEYVQHRGFDFGTDSLGKYYGEVAFVDYHIGRIVDLVRSKPWGARTAIVITSDHGEAFGEHGMIRHGFELWEPLVRVPLIIQVPGIEPRKITSRRSLIDLVPTMLDLLQVAAPTGQGTDFVSGQSLLPELLGIDGSDTPRPVLVDMAQGPFNADRQAYFDGAYKLLASDGRPLGLFDLARDPAEKQDLLEDRALRERIVTEYRAYKKNMHVVEVRKP